MSRAYFSGCIGPVLCLYWFFFNIIKFKRSYIYVTSNDMLVIAIIIHNYNNQSHVVIVWITSQSKTKTYMSYINGFVFEREKNYNTIGRVSRSKHKLYTLILKIMYFSIYFQTVQSIRCYFLFTPIFKTKSAVFIYTFVLLFSFIVSNLHAMQTIYPQIYTTSHICYLSVAYTGIYPKPWFYASWKFSSFNF